MHFRELTPDSLATDPSVFQNRGEVSGCIFNFSSVAYTLVRVVCPVGAVFNAMDLFPPVWDELRDLSEKTYFANERKISSELKKIGLQIKDEWASIFGCTRGFIELQLAVPRHLREKAESYFHQMEQAFGKTSVTNEIWGHRLEKSVVSRIVSHNSPLPADPSLNRAMLLALTSVYGVEPPSERLTIARDLLARLEGGQRADDQIPSNIQFALKHNIGLSTDSNSGGGELLLARARIVRALASPIFFSAAYRSAGLLKKARGGALLAQPEVRQAVSELERYLSSMKQTYPVCGFRLMSEAAS